MTDSEGSPRQLEIGDEFAMKLTRNDEFHVHNTYTDLSNSAFLDF
jgi:hypothetical protein